MYHQNITVSYDGSPKLLAYSTLQLQRPLRSFMKDIIAYAADLCDVTVAEIESKSRTKHLARCRFLIVYCTTRLRPDLSYSHIGKLLGGRDHSTAISANNRAIALRLQNPEFDEQCRELIIAFGGGAK